MSNAEPPPPPPYVGAPPDPVTRNGALAWGLGLVVLMCVPFLSSLLASIAMAVAGRMQRRQGPVAAANGRSAANWGLTYLVLSVLLVGTHFGLLFALTRDEPVQGFFPLGIPITTWLVVSVAHLVICVVGLVRAGRGQVLAVPAIPFFRD